MLSWFAREAHDPTQRILREHEKLMPPLTPLEYAQVVWTKAKGTMLWDVRGKTYYDFNGGIATSAIGHRHPKIIEAICKQAEVLDFVDGIYCCEINVGGKKYEISPAALAKKLLPILFPSKPLAEVNIVFDVTGSLAVDIGMDLGIKALLDRKVMISTEWGFHGRHRSRDLTCSNPIQRQNYPRAVEVYHLPFPDSQENFKAAMRYFLNFIPWRDVNTFWTEYLQGEGGYSWPDIDLMDKLLLTLRKHGILIGIDEVQSGLFRTGRWFAHQYGKVTPDIITLGKALGGGPLPISAVAYDRAIFNFNDKEMLEPGWYGATWSNYAVGIAAAIVFLDILQEEKITERVEPMGELLRSVLNKYNGHRKNGGY